MVNLDRHIRSQGGSQDLERPQAVFGDLRANYGDNFRAMMSIVEREHGNAADLLCRSKR